MILIYHNKYSLVVNSILRELIHSLDLNKAQDFIIESSNYLSKNIENLIISLLISWSLANILIT